MQRKEKNKQWSWLLLKGGGKVKVDAEDYNRLKENEWALRESKNRQPQVINMRWDAEKGKIITTYLAREVIQTTEKIVVVRKDTTKLDFRKENLIVCTRKEKERMRGKTKMETTSQYKGVSWDKKKEKWEASICVDNKRIHLGLYTIEQEAAKVYNEAAKNHFGDFSFFNTIK